MPATATCTISGSSVSGPKVATIACSGRTHSRLPALADCAPQRIDFGHGKVRSTTCRNSPITSIAGRPGFSVSAM